MHVAKKKGEIIGYTCTNGIDVCGIFHYEKSDADACCCGENFPLDEENECPSDIWVNFPIYERNPWLKEEECHLEILAHYRNKYRNKKPNIDILKGEQLSARDAPLDEFDRIVEIPLSELPYIERLFYSD